MKYLRTKNGIYESEKTSHDDKYVYKYEVRPIWCVNQEQTEILKQADTIEELCDGFIIGETLKIYNKSNFDFERKIVNLGHKQYYKFENLKSIYGVIMTFENDIPRIITVAKMNENGELCLI